MPPITTIKKKDFALQMVSVDGLIRGANEDLGSAIPIHIKDARNGVAEGGVWRCEPWIMQGK